ncbi:MAG: hypothetical protein QNJ91_09800 [Gammaproteobacteria bacterium]|nr:hypothetical protein [Gammaproteobacteria bacterium]
MPINLQPIDFAGELEGARSALLVLCPVCPQVSLAMQRDSPWIEFFKYGVKTGALEDHVKEICGSLGARGIRTAVFTTRLPLPMMCLWTNRQRRRLVRRAKDFDAVVVLGCDSAAFTARQVLSDTNCRVITGMRMVGITNATVVHRFPLTFDLQDKTRVEIGGKGAHKA